MNYTLFGVTDLTSQLEANFGPNTNLYDKLAGGLVYDDPILAPNTTDPFKPLVLTLNELAIKDINDAIQSRSVMFTISGHADLVSSVPEPSTWVLILAGFLGLGFAARRHPALRRRDSVSAGRSAF